MPGFDERLRQHLERLAPPADPSGAFDRILEKKIRRRILRRLQAASLVVVVVAATVGGTFALVRAFRSNGATERFGGIEPTPGPVKNGLIAYASIQSGNSDIWTANPDGSRADNITAESLADETYPAWSPDGTRIAFISDRDGQHEIYAMNSQGGDGRRLTHDSGIHLDPAWSPDGTKIAYVGGGEMDLFVMNADGSGLKQLTSGPDQDRHPTWAPDGSEIAFARLNSEPLPTPATPYAGGIYSTESNGGDLTRLTVSPDPFGPPDNWPDWSPDGRRIVFEHAGGIYLMNNDGSNTKQLPSDDGSGEPSWSPDGEQIVFEQLSGETGSQEITRMEADGSRVTPTGLTGSGDATLAPDWQPIPLAESATPPASLTPSPTPSPLPEECNASQVTGDFDGNRSPDLALVAKTECLMEPADRTDPYTTEYALDLQWHSGQEVHPAEGIAPLPDCEKVCQAIAAADLNGDGIDEFILKVDEGASTELIQVYELPASEAFGRPAGVIPPGGEDFPPGETAHFLLFGSVTHYGAMGCDLVKHHVIVRMAVELSDLGKYSVHETILLLQPTETPPFAEFKVVSERDYTERFDQGFGPGDQFEPGDACWVEQPTP